MSQVSHHPIRVSFENLVADCAHVIVVKSLKKQVVVFQATLSKESHYEKAGETEYQESAGLFRVVRILKSESLRIGDEIKVMTEPAYDFESMKRYHSTGVLESPAVLSYQSVYPPEGDEWILFVSGRSRHDGVWMQYLDAAEGVAAEKDIHAALQAPPPARGVLPV